MRNGNQIIKFFCYQGSDYYFNEDTDILSCETDGDGFSISFLGRDYDDKTKEYTSTLSLHTTDALLSYETEEEMLFYFQEKYPQMKDYRVYPTEYDLIYEGKKDTIFDDVFRYIEIGDNRYGYYTRNGKTYEVKEERENSIYSRISSVRSNAGYDYSEIFCWEKYEDGSTKQSDMVKESYDLERDIGVGEPFVFRMEYDETQTKESNGESIHIA